MGRKVAIIAGALLALAALLLLALAAPGQFGAAPSAAADDAVVIALRAGKPTVVEFGANACVACREMKPVLAALARNHAGEIVVADVDIIKQPAYIRRYNIQLMPTQVFFDARGRETGRHMGKISGTDILARLDRGSPGHAP